MASRKARDAVQIDQVGWRGEPELHHRDQTVAAGERAGVVAKVREQFHRIGQSRGPMVIEWARYHHLLPSVF